MTPWTLPPGHMYRIFDTQPLNLQHYKVQQRLLTMKSRILQVGNNRHNRSSTQAKQRDWSRCTHESTSELSVYQPNNHLSPLEDLLIQDTKSIIIRTHDDGILRPADLLGQDLGLWGFGCGDCLHPCRSFRRGSERLSM
jgi:hypothetical protein